MMNNYLFFIYYIYDPTKPCKQEYKKLGLSFLYEPFYIGKGKGRRPKDHFQQSKLNKNTKKNNKIKKILKMTNKKYFFEILKYNLTDSEAYNLEKKYINIIGKKIENKGPLLNIIDGGTGVGSGENAPSSKFSNNEISIIRNEYLNTNISIKKLCKKYNISTSSMYKIIKNLTYIDKNYNPPNLNKNGINNGRSNFKNNKDIEHIRNLYKKGETIKSISIKYNVSTNTILNIIKNKSFYDPTYKQPSLKQQGENHSQSKFNNDEIINIRNDYIFNNKSTKELSNMYNSSGSTILDIIKNKSYIDKTYTPPIIKKEIGIKKFNNKQIKKIRNLYLSGILIKDISKLFNAASVTIGKIVKNKIYIDKTYIVPTKEQLKIKRKEKIK